MSKSAGQGGEIALLQSRQIKQHEILSICRGSRVRIPHSLHSIFRAKLYDFKEHPAQFSRRLKAEKP